MARGPDLTPRKRSAWSAERREAAGAKLRICGFCGDEFWVSASQLKVAGGGKFCSRDCRYKGSIAHKQRRTEPVTRHSQGYLLEWCPDHPRASHGRVLQHILVAEKKLGRPLAVDEEVHHINRQRDDNRPENIEVVKRGEHQSMHWKEENFRRAQSEFASRQIQKRKRDPKTGRLLPN